MNERLKNAIATIIAWLIIVAVFILALVIIYFLIALMGYFVEYILTHVVDPVMARNQTLGYILFFIAPIGIVSYKIFKNV